MVNSVDKYEKTAILVALVLGLIPTGLICFDMQSATRLRLTDTHVHFRGAFGLSIPIDQIEGVKLVRWQDIPPTTKRKKAGSSSSCKKGLYATQNGNDIYCFLDNLYSDEVLYIKNKNTPDIYYVHKKGEQKALYEYLSNVLTSNKI